MAYTYSSWSVVFGEQPSASKWNIIGTNMASFNERIGSNFSSGTASTIWWEELGRHTLSGGADTLSVASFSARKFLKIILIALPTGGTINTQLRFNSDSGNNYNWRQSSNGGADSSTTTTSVAFLSASTGAFPMFSELLVINISAQEKLGIGQTVEQNTAGAGNATNKVENSFKWANTSAQISTVACLNTGTGDFASGSSLVVLGHD